jgi:alpha-beta hydrolase superfamily lysophospholipase
VRRWLRWTLAILLVVALGYAAFVGYVSWKSAESLVHPARSVPPYAPADVGLAYERVAFTTSDGLRLVGWWMPAGAAANGTVVFLHGYGDSKNQSLAYAPFLHADGMNVLAFDFRAHGESQGDHTTVGLDEVRDVQAAVSFAKTKSAAPVVLYGLSMGAAAALNAAPTTPDVRAVVSDSSFATLQNIASNSITHFTHLPKYPYGPLAVLFASRIVHEDVSADAPVRAIAHVTVPVLLVQGGADDIAVAATDGAVLHAADPASQYLYVPAAHHVESHAVDRAEYEARVTGFLNAALS